MPGGQRLAGGLVHLGHFVHHLGHKGGGARLAGVDEGHLVVELHRGDVGGIGRVGQTELVRLGLFTFSHQALVTRLHGDHGGTGVGRHVDLGDHGHAAGLGIAHQVDVVGLAVETGTLVVAGRAGAQLRHQALGFGLVVATLAADVGQLRQARDLQTPAFIVGQPQVQHVELHGGHLIHQLLQGLGASEVTGHVGLHAAVFKARGILDGHLAHQLVVDSQEGDQGLGTPEGAFDVVPLNDGALLADGHVVAFGLLELAAELDGHWVAGVGEGNTQLGQLSLQGFGAIARQVQGIELDGGEVDLRAGLDHLLHRGRQDLVVDLASRQQGAGLVGGETGFAVHQDVVVILGALPAVGRHRLLVGGGIVDVAHAGQHFRLGPFAGDIPVRHDVRFEQYPVLHHQRHFDRGILGKALELLGRRQTIEVAGQVGDGELVVVHPLDAADGGDIDAPVLGGDVSTGIGQVQLGNAAARPLGAQRLAVETGTGTVVGDDFVLDDEVAGEGVDHGLLGGIGCKCRTGENGRHGNG